MPRPWKGHTAAQGLAGIRQACCPCTPPCLAHAGSGPWGAAPAQWFRHFVLPTLTGPGCWGCPPPRPASGQHSALAHPQSCAAASFPSAPQSWAQLPTPCRARGLGQHGPISGCSPPGLLAKPRVGVGTRRLGPFEVGRSDPRSRLAQGALEEWGQFLFSQSDRFLLDRLCWHPGNSRPGFSGWLAPRGHGGCLPPGAGGPTDADPALPSHRRLPAPSSFPRCPVWPARPFPWPSRPAELALLTPGPCPSALHTGPPAPGSTRWPWLDRRGSGASLGHPFLWRGTTSGPRGRWLGSPPSQSHSPAPPEPTESGLKTGIHGGT